MITKLIFWVILIYGHMNIMVYGSIFEGLRNLLNMLGEKFYFFKFLYGIISCPMCFSTWAGFFYGFLIYSPTYVLFFISPDFSWFFDGILASGGVWIINSIVEFFEENRISK